MIVVVKFIICAGLIFWSGKRVALYGDVIAEKTGLGGLWIGVILISVATSLPELFTGVGSILFVGDPNLSVGNLLGANTYNLLNIAFLDMYYKKRPLLSVVSQGQLLTAVLSLAPLTIAAIGIIVTSTSTDITIAGVSVFSILIVASYVVATRIIFRYEKNRVAIVSELHTEEKDVLSHYGHITLTNAIIRYASAGIIIAGSGIWLSYIGNELADVLGMGTGAVGTIFLGIVTTLPEITVSIAALRLGAVEMALANMFGSNLFNIIIITINDVLYRKASMFSTLSSHHVFNVCVVVLMTVIVMTAMMIKPKQKTKWGVSMYGLILMGVFIFSSWGNILLSNSPYAERIVLTCRARLQSCNNIMRVFTHFSIHR